MTPWVRASLQGLDTVRSDLLVIGGGITGAGVARDAALRGLRVALVEGHDYASGTSSRSSRRARGGGAGRRAARFARGACGRARLRERDVEPVVAARARRRPIPRAWRARTGVRV